MNDYHTFRYVWEHLETGYMQGMCDLVAPLLVMMKEEASAHALFAKLMDRAKDNFPSGSAMDAHFADMRFELNIKLKLVGISSIVNECRK